MPFYHCNRESFNVGDIIQPGNWGRILIATGPMHSSWNREIILEFIRIQYFSSKPSRLNSTFVCDNLETIRFYKNFHMATANVYEVEHLNPIWPIHKGDFNAVEPLPTVRGDMITIALGYWEYKYKTSVKDYESVECSEFVSASALKVVAILN